MVRKTRSFPGQIIH
jgi:hypothetical protein